jgi:hypothetical protein
MKLELGVLDPYTNPHELSKVYLEKVQIKPYVLVHANIFTRHDTFTRHYCPRHIRLYAIIRLYIRTWPPIYTYNGNPTYNPKTLPDTPRCLITEPKA